MISNYIKLALRAMMRNKFFSAISLFGISFTLAILMLIISMLETEVGKTRPLLKKDKMVIMHSLGMKRQYYDTIYTYDSTYINHNLVIDTTYKVNDAGQSSSNSDLAWSFLERHFSDLPSVKYHTFCSLQNTFNAYVNNSKVEMHTGYVDAGFWDVTDFKFTEGYPFGEEAIDQQSKVAVITTKLADEYFGRTKNLVDETVFMDGKTFKIKGVVEPAGMNMISSNIFIPHTLHIPNESDEEIGFGDFKGFFIAKDGMTPEQIKSDIDLINDQLEVSPSVADSFDEIEAAHSTYHEIYAHRLLYLEEDEDSLRVMKYILFGILAFFILLPTLNLINLNVSRILERSSEIGVRKAFGATQSNILFQFIIENIIQTFIGAILGLGLALIAIRLINDAGWLGDIILKINFTFFLYSFLIALAFGIISGILPAYRMSRAQIVNALKQYKL